MKRPSDWAEGVENLEDAVLQLRCLLRRQGLRPKWRGTPCEVLVESLQSAISSYDEGCEKADKKFDAERRTCDHQGGVPGEECSVCGQLLV